MTPPARGTSDPRLYMQISEDLRAKIAGGVIKANARVTVTDLTQQWGACRQTASKALGVLQDDGLVRLYPGHGYYVLPHSE